MYKCTFCTNNSHFDKLPKNILSSLEILPKLPFDAFLTQCPDKVDGLHVGDNSDLHSFQSTKQKKTDANAHSFFEFKIEFGKKTLLQLFARNIF